MDDLHSLHLAGADHLNITEAMPDKARPDRFFPLARNIAIGLYLAAASC